MSIETYKVNDNKLLNEQQIRWIIWALIDTPSYPCVAEAFNNLFESPKLNSGEIRRVLIDNWYISVDEDELHLSVEEFNSKMDTLLEDTE